ncbi:SOS response-associated peptidase family protein [Caenibius sp. WL]|uniref:SOS response-associated peptidase n=1 Tax=Caenibius sp. WL TaxID=2872646 RepID=UPI001C99CB52|nr:SOS response-associated peptidase family protein [Caenibius sp. WL]QZP06781.1 SOS response-associated peptidase [Caenibius sp. WL]
MCNLYRLDPSQKIFDFTPADIQQFNVPVDVYPTYPGLVVEGRKLKRMTWGIPMHFKGKAKPAPVNNARGDRLRTLWRVPFERRRLLIPVSQWAEAQGEKGRMTKTWCSVPGQAPFMVAGIWNPSVEWGDSYSMVMTDSSPQIAHIHDRMPVILAPEHYAQWTEGTPEEAFALVRPWDGPIAVDATAELWSARRKPAV